MGDKGQQVLGLLFGLVASNTSMALIISLHITTSISSVRLNQNQLRMN